MTKEDAKTLVLYQTEDGAVTLQVSVEDDTVWLTQMKLAELFQRELCIRDRSTVSENPCK